MRLRLRFLPLIAMTLGVLFAVPPAAHAQIVNGDFESDTGWTPDVPADWSFFYYFDLSVPTRYGWMQCPDIAGLGCIKQTFQCGTAGGTGSCIIGLDATLLDQRPGAPVKTVNASQLGGRFKVFVDGALLLTSEESNGFTHFEVQAPCGQHELSICLEADPGNGGSASMSTTSRRAVRTR